LGSQAEDGGRARYAWLGASDSSVEGTWKWIDNALMSAGYTNWGESDLYVLTGNDASFREPDNYLGAQDVLAMGLDAWPTLQPQKIGDASEWNDLS